MTWTFSASGTKETCVAQLGAGTPPTDAADAKQYERARAIVMEELGRYGDGSAGLSISASGHAPGKGGGDRSFSIWISGKAAAVAEPAAKVVEPPPAAEPAAKSEHSHKRK
jgi:hypothetical protein